MNPEPLSYPDRLEITPLSHAVSGTVRVPGSKSMTNRALVLAALYPPAAGPHGNRSCTLRGALQSEDTDVMIESLRRLGYRIEPDWQAFEPLVVVASEFNAPQQ